MGGATVSARRMLGIVQRICNVEFKIVSQETDARLGVLEVYRLIVGSLYRVGQSADAEFFEHATCTFWFVNSRVPISGCAVRDVRPRIHRAHASQCLVEAMFHATDRSGGTRRGGVRRARLKEEPAAQATNDDCISRVWVAVSAGCVSVQAETRSCNLVLIWYRNEAPRKLRSLITDLEKAGLQNRGSEASDQNFGHQFWVGWGQAICSQTFHGYLQQW
jgi:hypothetical protein